MSPSTLPHTAGTGRASRSVSSVDGLDPRTDEGLRDALRGVERSGSWATPDGQALLAEVRRRAVRNAAHVATMTGVAMERGLVDDVLLAAWMVLRRHGDKVLAAARPWAYLMSSAQRQVLDEIRAQQLLTNAASIRGRAREVLPSVVRTVGSTATDLATALGHEPSDLDTGDARRIVRQVRQHEQPPLVRGSEPDTPPRREREPWFCAFIDLLVTHGADQAVTVAAVDRLADLFAATYVGWWEWAARRDPVLGRLGLSPDQCGALVALVAGSRKYRHNGKHDSLLAAVRTADEHEYPVELSPAFGRRIAVFTRAVQQQRPPAVADKTLALAGVQAVSIEASSFVLGLSMGRGNGIRKLILLGYANHADKHGRGAYPSTHTIADYAECDVRTVQRHVGWLLERGFLHEGDQRMVDHLDPRYRPIVYDVAMSTEQINQWAAGTGPSSGNRTRAA